MRSGGIGASVSSWISENLLEELDHEVIRLSSQDVPTAYAKLLEDATIVQVRLSCVYVGFPCNALPRPRTCSKPYKRFVSSCLFVARIDCKISSLPELFINKQSPHTPVMIHLSTSSIALSSLGLWDDRTHHPLIIQRVMIGGPFMK